MAALAEDFREAVYAVVKLIPRGQVATYAQVATYVVAPRYARAVGTALKQLPRARLAEVPWQRVINAAGRISARGEVERPTAQARLLAREGVVIEGDGRIRLEVFQWRGPGPTWRPLLDDPEPPRPDPLRPRPRGHRLR